MSFPCNAVLALQITGAARQVNDEIHIIARAADIDQIRDLHEKGAYEAIQPEFEASLEFLRQAPDSSRLPARTGRALHRYRPPRTLFPLVRRGRREGRRRIARKQFGIGMDRVTRPQPVCWSQHRRTGPANSDRCLRRRHLA